MSIMGSVTRDPSFAIALQFHTGGKMINSLDTYLQRGYSDIFLVGGGPNSQADNWHQTEKDTEVVVARKGTEFVRATCAVTSEIRPGSNSEAEITQEDIITREEYERLASGRSIMDQPEDRKRFAERESAAQARAMIEGDAPKCPDHEKRMKLRHGRFGFFFECTRCRRKTSLNAEQKRLADGTPALSKFPLH